MIIADASFGMLLVFLGVFALAFLAWRRLDLGAALVLFCSPLYVFKITSFVFPTNILEIFLLTLLVVWFLKKEKLADFFWELRDFAGIYFWLPLVLILISSSLATVFSDDLRTSAGILKSWIFEPIAFGIILLDVIKIKKQAKILLFSLIFSGATVALSSLFYFFNGQVTFDSRLRAFFLSPNQLAMLLSISLILAVGFLLSLENKHQKNILVVCVGLLLFGLYFTFSYAAWLAVLLSVGFMIFFLVQWQNHKSKKALILSLVVIFVFFIVLFFSQWGGAKLNDLISSDRSSWQSRLVIWQSALKILNDHWLMGVGPGMFQKHYLEYQKYFSVPYLEWASPQPHNLFLAWWLQAGFLGLSGLVLLLIAFFNKTLRSLMKQKQPLVLITAAVLACVLIHGLVDTTYWKNDLSLIFWAVIFLGYKAVHLID